MIVIIDYGAGNLRSVANAVTRLGYHPKITDCSDEIINAQALILPGVGSAADTMANLKSMNLISPIRDFIIEGKPFLGICIGLQILLTRSEEGKGCPCLDIFPGLVHELPSKFKIPHMGWNQVKQKKIHPVFDGIPNDANFYFVHSYYAKPDDESLVAGETEYGIKICSVIANGNLVATQFHPEKSGELGLKLYDNFLKIALGIKMNNF